MAMRLTKSLDRGTLFVQKLLGPEVTRWIQENLSSEGRRFVMEVLGRSARHRVQVTCRKELIGIGNDAWVICPEGLTSQSRVYSLGVGNEIVFDLALINRFGLEVFAFDPTPHSIAWVRAQKLPKQFHFIEYGIANFDGTAKFYNIAGDQWSTTTVSLGSDAYNCEVYRLQTIMKSLGHEGIDLLKINIEGGEYAVIDDLIACQIDVGQLVVQFHHHFAGHSLADTERAVNNLNKHGYQIFHISETGKEYSFIR